MFYNLVLRWKACFGCAKFCRIFGQSRLGLLAIFNLYLFYIIMISIKTKSQHQKRIIPRYFYVPYLRWCFKIFGQFISACETFNEYKHLIKRYLLGLRKMLNRDPTKKIQTDVYFAKNKENFCIKDAGG